MHLLGILSFKNTSTQLCWFVSWLWTLKRTRSKITNWVAVEHLQCCEQWTSVAPRLWCWEKPFHLKRNQAFLAKLLILGFGQEMYLLSWNIVITDCKEAVKDYLGSFQKDWRNDCTTPTGQRLVETCEVCLNSWVHNYILKRNWLLLDYSMIGMNLLPWTLINTRKKQFILLFLCECTSG